MSISTFLIGSVTFKSEPTISALIGLASTDVTLTRRRPDEVLSTASHNDAPASDRLANSSTRPWPTSVETLGRN
jgi:hypothetical protein